MVSRKDRDELLLDAHQSWASIYQLCPNQPDSTAIDPSREGGQGPGEGCWVVVDPGNRPAVAASSSRKEGWPPLPGGGVDRMTPLRKRRGGKALTPWGLAVNCRAGLVRTGPGGASKSGPHRRSRVVLGTIIPLEQTLFGNYSF